MRPYEESELAKVSTIPKSSTNYDTNIIKGKCRRGLRLNRGLYKEDFIPLSREFLFELSSRNSNHELEPEQAVDKLAVRLQLVEEARRKFELQVEQSVRLALGLLAMWRG